MVDLVYGMGITDIIKDAPTIFSIKVNTYRLSFLTQNHSSMALQILSTSVIYIVRIVTGGKLEETN